MDVTPRELREIDFRTEWKGYHRDDVDDLLERAATTIEAQNERVRQIVERADALQAETAQAAPASRETEDMLRRTLVLAQRTADEAVAEAQTEARRITEEADTHARRVVSEAEANARRVAEGERQRLEAEVLELGARREALLADVEQLERFANDYRARLRSAIERDLDTLATRPPVVDAPRPRLHEVDIPAANANNNTQSSPAPRPPAGASPPARTNPAPGTAAPTGPASGAPAPPPFTPADATTPAPNPSPAPAAPVPPAAQATPFTPAPPTPDPVPPVERAGSPADAAPAAPSAASEGERTIELDKEPSFPGPPSASEPLEAEVLDDDAFFASLREAVRDDSPLGPRSEESEVSLDDDQDGRFGNVFKRRR
ncbi:MAG: DivIVA domain-containing protein [Acidimicrobiia bacterium]